MEQGTVCELVGKAESSGRSPDLPNQNLHCNRIPQVTPAYLKIGEVLRSLTFALLTSQKCG